MSGVERERILCSTHEILSRNLESYKCLRQASQVLESKAFVHTNVFHVFNIVLQVVFTE